METLIFEKSREGRRAFAQAPGESKEGAIPAQFLREDTPRLPEASELQVVRHFTRLSQLNFSIDTQFYPLGSCTMKYNPRACNATGAAARFCRAPSARAGQPWPGILELHVRTAGDAPGNHRHAGCVTDANGRRAGRAGRCCDDPGLPSRGAAIMNATRLSCRTPHTVQTLRPQRCAAVSSKKYRPAKDGDIDLDALRAVVGPNTAGIMLTNPSTLGVRARHPRS